jgi:hypothetical protein
VQKYALLSLVKRHALTLYKTNTAFIVLNTYIYLIRMEIMNKIDITLNSIFPDSWKENYSKNLIDLVQAPYENLSTTEKDLRSLAVNLIHSFERSPIHTPFDLLGQIQSYHITVPSNKWLIIAINSDNNKHYIKTKGDKIRLSSAVFNFLPKPDMLTKKVPLPNKGKYIIIRGSGLDILANEKALLAYKEIQSKFSISDLAFYQSNENAPSFYSIAAKCGKIGSKKVDFPNINIMERWSL